VIDKMTEFARVLSTQPNMSVPGKQDASLSEASFPPNTAKKRLILGALVFFERTYSLIGSNVTVVGIAGIAKSLQAALEMLSELATPIAHKRTPSSLSQTFEGGVRAILAESESARASHQRYAERKELYKLLRNDFFLGSLSFVGGVTAGLFSIAVDSLALSAVGAFFLASAGLFGLSLIGRAEREQLVS
jgi:hypothetical protein